MVLPLRSVLAFSGGFECLLGILQRGLTCAVRYDERGVPIEAEVDYPIGVFAVRQRATLPIVTLTTAAGMVQHLWRCEGVRDDGCDRLVRSLYLPPGGAEFACRHCHRLAYRSNQRHDKNASRRGELLHAFVRRCRARILAEYR